MFQRLIQNITFLSQKRTSMVGYQTRLGSEALWPERVTPHQSFKFALTFLKGGQVLLLVLQSDYTGSVQVASHISPIGLVAINWAFDTGSRIHSWAPYCLILFHFVSRYLLTCGNF